MFHRWLQKVIRRSAVLSALCCAYYAYQSRTGRYDQPTPIDADLLTNEAADNAARLNELTALYDQPAPIDADLQCVIELWPQLTPEQARELRYMVDAFLLAE